MLEVQMGERERGNRSRVARSGAFRGQVEPVVWGRAAHRTGRRIAMWARPVPCGSTEPPEKGLSSQDGEGEEEQLHITGQAAWDLLQVTNVLIPAPLPFLHL